MIDRRVFLGSGIAGVLGLGLAGCASAAAGSTSTSSTSTSAAAAPSGAPTGGPGGMGGPPSGGTMGGAGGGGASTETAAAKALAAQVKGKFASHTYTDASTGKKLPFNLFLPDGYSAKKSYPMVLYIADSSLVGQAVTAPLNQYGALVWAGAADQAKHPSIVVVPEYPEIIIDDNSGHTTTAYLELTARFVRWIQTRYSVDPKRVYGTGQSMGCMTVLYLTAQHPGLFSAEYFVSGQWQVSQLAGLKSARFISFAAGGDSKASGGQADIKKILDAADVTYDAAEWDATWSSARTATAAAALLAKTTRDHFVTFKTGTVLKANTTAGSEHMASFEPAYKVTAARDWLFAQRG